jgi:spore coat polysaccharide biosynthesis predicted glycosyltransferase SpsG
VSVIDIPLQGKNLKILYEIELKNKNFNIAAGVATPTTVHELKNALKSRDIVLF